jgi:hypothetical protein
MHIIQSTAIKLHCEYAHYVLSLYFESRGFSYPKVLEEDNEDLNAADESKADISAASVFDEEFVDGEMLAAVNESVRWHLSEVGVKEQGYRTSIYT